MKSVLKKLLIVLSSLGAIFAAYPFISSLGTNDKTDNEAILTITISDMRIGDVKKIDNAYYLYKQSNETFLLMNGWAPFRRCPIYYIKAGEADYPWENRIQYNDKSHFIDKCEGALWELSGKLVEGTAYHKERDMEQRKFEKVKDDYILFHRGKS